MSTDTSRPADGTTTASAHAATETGWRRPGRAGSFAWIGVAYLVAIGVGVAVGATVPGHPVTKAFAGDLAATLVIFVFSVILNNSSMYDAYWSVAPPVIAVYWCSVAAGGVPVARQVLVLVCVLAWALRLTANWARGWSGLDHEDWRYVDMRASSGKGYWGVSFGGLHLFPTLEVFLACVPLWPALAAGTRPFGVLDGVAAIVCLGGVALELVADEQMKRFVASRPPAGTPMRTGLWGWSRHPNYFGEICFWVGVYLFGLAADPSWWWTVIGPAAIVVMFVTASIPLMEKRSAARRPAYAEVIAEVPMLIPRPPRARPAT